MSTEANLWQDMRGEWGPSGDAGGSGKRRAAHLQVDAALVAQVLGQPAPPLLHLLLQKNSGSGRGSLAVPGEAAAGEAAAVAEEDAMCEDGLEDPLQQRGRSKAASSAQECGGERAPPAQRARRQAPSSCCLLPRFVPLFSRSAAPLLLHCGTQEMQGQVLTSC